MERDDCTHTVVRQLIDTITGARNETCCACATLASCRPSPPQATGRSVATVVTLEKALERPANTYITLMLVILCLTSKLSELFAAPQHSPVPAGLQSPSAPVALHLAHSPSPIPCLLREVMAACVLGMYNKLSGLQLECLTNTSMCAQSTPQLRPVRSPAAAQILPAQLALGGSDPGNLSRFGPTHISQQHHSQQAHTIRTTGTTL